MIAKMILPKFGGSPAVWNTSMVFFQAMLLLGYLYAHLSTRWLGPKRQALLHLIVFFVALTTLPFAIPASYAPSESAPPAFQLLLLLLGQVGLAFFVISAGAPLLQKWYATTDDPQAKDPYFLYSASNLGSMLALLSYPLLVEPAMRLAQQSGLWTLGYVILAMLMVVSAVALWITGNRVRNADDGTVLEMGPLPGEGVEAETETADDPPTNRRRLLWVMLAFVPSSLLLGVTTYLTSDVAPVPLLWVIPLTLYLITFIWAFSKKPPQTKILGRLVPLLATPIALIMVLEASDPFVILGLIHLLVFFVIGLLCHTRVAETRPSVTHLTEFYLWISVGGVLGGAFNALAAPVLFNNFWEYPAAIVLACMLRPPNDQSSKLKIDLAYAVGVGALMVALVLITRAVQMEATSVRTVLIMGVPLIATFIAVDHRYRYALSLGAFFIVSAVFNVSAGGEILHSARSFFGVHRVAVTGNGAFHELFHGKTIHGRESTDPAKRDIPLTYYYPSGPIGQVFRAFSKPGELQDVALVGLGVGSLAAYSQPGQTFTYYEIDPVVKDIAQDTDYFHFLADAKGKVDIVLGDARLTIRNAPDGSYDLIVLDAFSSDAVPVHLLTKEAVEIYLSKLKPHGFLAFHISNRYLDLQNMICDVGGSLGLVCYDQYDAVISEQEVDAGKEPSHWLVLARDKADIEPLAKSVYWLELEPRPDEQVWTDDYSNLLKTFKRDETFE